MKIIDLITYPIKSAGGIHLEQAVLKPTGLPWDRHWMLIDEQNKFVSQRQLPKMMHLEVDFQSDGIKVDYPGQKPVLIPFTTADLTEPFNVTMHRRDEIISVVAEHSAISAWFSKALGGNYRIVRLAPSFKRTLPDQPEETVHLSDGYPFLVASKSSLDLLNDYLLEQDPLSPALEMARFRPNIVIDGLKPWAEMESGLTLSGSNVCFSLTKPCQRCGIPQLNMKTAERDIGSILHQALTNLCSSIPESTNCFGQNAILKTGEGLTIEVGMKMQVEC